MEVFVKLCCVVQVCKGSPIIGRDVSDNVVQTSSDHVMKSRDDHVIETRADTTLLCSQCCTGDLCNAASCGQPGTCTQRWSSDMTERKTARLNLLTYQMRYKNYVCIFISHK